MPTTLSNNMAKQGKPKGGPPVGKKTCQLMADVVYWAGIIASFEDCGIAEALDPAVREYVRQRLKSHGVDPDEAWRKSQSGE